MRLTPQTQAIIDAMSEAILIVSQEKGQVIGWNNAFLEEGLGGGDLAEASLIRLPQLTRTVRHELVGLYIKTLREEGMGGTFRFRKALEGSSREKEYLVTSRLAQFEGMKYILFKFASDPLQPAAPAGFLGDVNDEMRGCKIFLEMTGESWMEFRPRAGLMPKSCEFDDRKEYLRRLGEVLFIHSSSVSAKRTYGELQKNLDVLPAPLTEKNFLSLFCREDDALRFLDMLSSVGQLRANTLLVEGDGSIVDVELSCLAYTQEDGEIKAIYCTSKSHEELKRYRMLLHEARVEQDFYINQPFIGLGRLMSISPIERPTAGNVEEKLPELVEQLRIVGTNDLLASFYGLPKSALLMQPMSRLFPETSYAVQILKELFVTRTSSFAEHDPGEGEPHHVLIFKACFNNTDCLTKILIAASRNTENIHVRHNNRRDGLLNSFIA